MKKIILISGKAENGKSTVGDYLKVQLEKSGYKVVKDLFAKYIKGYFRDYYGWDGVTKTKKVRSGLEKKGTEDIKIKYNYKCFHAKRIAEDFQIFEDEFDYFIVDDCRFRDEIYTMKAMFPDDIITIRINRLGYINSLTEEQKNHISETDLDNFKDFDYVFNIQTKGELYKKCNEVLKDIID